MVFNLLEDPLQAWYNGLYCVRVEWGQKSKPPKFLRASNKAKLSLDQNLRSSKNPMLNFQSVKIAGGTMRLGYKGTITKLQIILRTQKNPYLNQATQKIPAKIFLPKKIPKSKFSNPKRSFNLPCHLKSGVPPGAVFNCRNVIHSWQGD